MYELYSKWSIVSTYEAGNAEELLIDRMPEKSLYRYIEGETVKVDCKKKGILNERLLKSCIGTLDREITARVAMSKYLTASQIYEYMHLQGFEETKDQVVNHIRKLVNYRVLQECCLMPPGEIEKGSTLSCYRLDYWGRIIALEEEVPFHREILYISHRRRVELGQEKNMEIYEDSAIKIKRILAANMILLNMLKTGVDMNRFGFLETFRPVEDRGWSQRHGNVPIVRTALNVVFDKAKIRAYEIVRDCPEAYGKLADKIRRYYCLESSWDYLMDNYHGYDDVPQMVICGESWVHNMKIKEFLMQSGLWDERLPILFTEDLLNLENTAQSVYAIAENGECIWEAMSGVKKFYVA